MWHSITSYCSSYTHVVQNVSVWLQQKKNHKHVTLGTEDPLKAKPSHIPGMQHNFSTTPGRDLGQAKLANPSPKQTHWVSYSGGGPCSRLAASRLCYLPHDALLVRWVRLLDSELISASLRCARADT